MKRLILAASDVMSLQYHENIPLAAGMCYVIDQTDAQHASALAQREGIRYAKIIKVTSNYVIYDVYRVEYGYLDLYFRSIKKSTKNFIRICTGNGMYLCFANEDKLFEELNIDPYKEFNVSPGTVFSSYTANSQGHNSVIFTVVLDVSNDEVHCRKHKYCDKYRLGKNMYKDVTYSIGEFAQKASHNWMHQYNSLQEFVDKTGLDADVVNKASWAGFDW